MEEIIKKIMETNETEFNNFRTMLKSFTSNVDETSAAFCNEEEKDNAFEFKCADDQNWFF